MSLSHNSLVCWDSKIAVALKNTKGKTKDGSIEMETPVHKSLLWLRIQTKGSLSKRMTEGEGELCLIVSRQHLTHGDSDTF